MYLAGSLASGLSIWLVLGIVVMLVLGVLRWILGSWTLLVILLLLVILAAVLHWVAGLQANAPPTVHPRPTATLAPPHPHVGFTIGGPVVVALALLGIGSATLVGRHVYHHVAWPGTFPWRVRRTMVELGLVSKAGEEPQLHRKSRQGDVWHLAWQMPVGVHTERVEAQRRALEEALDCSVRVWPEAGRLHMRVGRARIPELHMLSDAPAAGKQSREDLPVYLGQSREGALWAPLARFPHMLVGGTSGGGKTALVQALVLQLAMAYSPTDLRLVLVDLKGGVDMAVFDGLPNLLFPVVGRHDAAASVLSQLVDEQERRQDLMRGRAVKLTDWNALVAPEARLPHVVVVIDEFADLLPKDAVTATEKDIRAAAWTAVSALTRMGRASGIHVVIATQRAAADVLPGQIRANCPATVAFFCANEFNSGILLGQGNAAAARLPCRMDGQPLPGRAIFQWGREVPFQAVHVPAAEIERQVGEIRRAYTPRMPDPAPESVISLPTAAEEAI